MEDKKLKKILEEHGKWLRNKGGERANLRSANLRSANLRSADLRSADLWNANLRSANLQDADLRSANLQDADLQDADLRNAKNMIKLMSVEPGNYYWKRFDHIEKDGKVILCNNGYTFKIGLNKLEKGEKFASDDRVLCSYPGFHFASRSWCAINYKGRRYEAKIQIPNNAQINEPWATDGKASADRIKIIQVFDTESGEDVTELLK